MLIRKVLLTVANEECTTHYDTEKDLQLHYYFFPIHLPSRVQKHKAPEQPRDS